jgi:peroxin-5
LFLHVDRLHQYQYHIDEGAIEAYWKVLSLKPSFVRGRYNLGVSCMNIGCFKEAAEHFLAALSLHDDIGGGRGRGDQDGVQGGGEPDKVVHVSRTLWDTLHRNFIMVCV